MVKEPSDPNGKRKRGRGPKPSKPHKKTKRGGGKNKRKDWHSSDNESSEESGKDSSRRTKNGKKGKKGRKEDDNSETESQTADETYEEIDALMRLRHKIRLGQVKVGPPIKVPKNSVKPTIVSTSTTVFTPVANPANTDTPTPRPIYPSTSTQLLITLPSHPTIRSSSPVMPRVNTAPRTPRTPTAVDVVLHGTPEDTSGITLSLTYDGDDPMSTTHIRVPPVMRSVRGATPRPRPRRTSPADIHTDSESDISIHTPDSESDVSIHAVGIHTLPSVCASWFEDAFKTMAKNKLGPEWDNILQLLLRFESRSGSIPKLGPAKFGTAGRPAQVAWWIKRARKPDPEVEDEDAVDFGEDWWNWWKGMQPAWRGIQDVVGPITSRFRKGSGDWEALNNTGPNGFLSIVAALGWWGSTRKDDSWVEALSDVRWVLNSLLHATDDATETINKTSKRQRTA